MPPPIGEGEVIEGTIDEVVLRPKSVVVRIEKLTTVPNRSEFFAPGPLRGYVPPPDVHVAFSGMAYEAFLKRLYDRSVQITSLPGRPVRVVGGSMTDGGIGRFWVADVRVI